MCAKSHKMGHHLAKDEEKQSKVLQREETAILNYFVFVRHGLMQHAVAGWKVHLR